MLKKVENWMTSHACVDCACVGKQRSIAPPECSSCAYGKDASPLAIAENVFTLHIEGQGHGNVEIPRWMIESIKEVIKYHIDNMIEEETCDNDLEGTNIVVGYNDEKFMLVSDWEKIYTDEELGVQLDANDTSEDFSIVCPYCEEKLTSPKTGSIMVCPKCHNNIELVRDNE